MDHQPTESLGPQEGTIGLVYNFDLVQIQNPFKFQLRTTPSSFPFHPFRTLHFSHSRPPTVHFLSGPRIVMGSKVDGHWTLPLDLTPKLDLFKIQNPFKSILRTLPSFLFCILSNFDIFQNFAKSTPIPNLTHSLWTTNLLSHSVHRRVL